MATPTIGDKAIDFIQQIDFSSLPNHLSQTRNYYNVNGEAQTRTVPFTGKADPKAFYTEYLGTLPGTKIQYTLDNPQHPDSVAFDFSYQRVAGMENVPDISVSGLKGNELTIHASDEEHKALVGEGEAGTGLTSVSITAQRAKDGTYSIVSDAFLPPPSAFAARFSVMETIRNGKVLGTTISNDDCNGGEPLSMITIAPGKNPTGFGFKETQSDLKAVTGIDVDLKHSAQLSPPTRAALDFAGPTHKIRIK